MLPFLKRVTGQKQLATWLVGQRNLWKWNKPPTDVAKIEKLSLSYYSYKPEYLLDKDELNCPIIAAHGLYTSKEYFYELAATLAKQLRRQVYLIDLRHHGESPHRAFDGPASLMVHAQDVVNFMDEFKIARALLIGHGLGGRAMVQCALMNDARVDKVITVDISQDGTSVFSKNFPKYLYYLNEIDPTVSNGSLSYARLVMKEILRGQVKNPMTLKYVLENLRIDSEGKYKWRFNVRILEQLLTNWSQVRI